MSLVVLFHIYACSYVQLVFQTIWHLMPNCKHQLERWGAKKFESSCTFNFLSTETEPTLLYFLSVLSSVVYHTCSFHYEQTFERLHLSIAQLSLDLWSR